MSVEAEGVVTDQSDALGGHNQQIMAKMPKYKCASRNSGAINSTKLKGAFWDCEKMAFDVLTFLAKQMDINRMLCIRCRLGL